MSAGVSRERVARPPHELRRALALAVWSAVTLAAVVVVSRRLAGAFSPREAGAALPCLASTVAILLSLAAHTLWRSAQSAQATIRRQAVAIGVTMVPAFALGAALWTASSAFVGGYLGGLFLVSGLVALSIQDNRPFAMVWTIIDGTAPDSREKSVSRESHRAGSAEIHASAMPTEITLLDDDASSRVPREGVEVGRDEVLADEADEEIEKDSSIVQSLTRRQLADGSELVEGAVRVAFADGEKTASAHVAFVPPLNGRPQADCQIISDFDGRAKIGLAEAYGLHIEVRRAESSDSEAATVDVAFSTQTRAAQSAAA